MKVWVDKNECISCGVCVEMCPEVFRMNADDVSECYNQEGASMDEIKEAVEACPVSCIHID